MPTGLLPEPVSTLPTVLHKYDAVMMPMAWPVAQNYCRVMYTDLATILSVTDWPRLDKETERKALYLHSWTGLYKDIYSWRWSLNDIPLQNVTFSNWYLGQPDNYHQQETCGILAANDQWHDVPCNLLRPFLCYDGKSKL